MVGILPQFLRPLHRTFLFAPRFSSPNARASQLPELRWSFPGNRVVLSCKVRLQRLILQRRTGAEYYQFWIADGSHKIVHMPIEATLVMAHFIESLPSPQFYFHCSWLCATCKSSVVSCRANLPDNCAIK